MGRDSIYLLDMMQAAAKVKEFTQGTTRDEFDQDEILQNAVVRLIQVIGEAARLVSQETKDAHPEIPWRKIAGMRNKIIHRYFEIDLDIVWEVVSVDAEELISKIEPLVPPDSHPEGSE